MCVRAGVRVHGPANHKLIEAIRELAEQRLIATPDGQAHGVNAPRTFKKTHASSCAPLTHIKANSLRAKSWRPNDFDRLMEGISARTATWRSA